jgi:predicted GIY-YIG superfamily endonuclease
MAPEIVHTVTGRAIKAKRQQYGMKHRIAATIHATMGCEFDKLVTAVSKQNKSYALWEKEQVVVLLSRTKCAKDLIFVGNQEDTLDALCELIQLKSQFSEYMAHVLNQLCDSNEHERRCPTTFPAIDYGYHPYRPIDIEKPQDSSGFCYILVSLKNFASTYIGQSWNLVKRLKEHNTGHGSQQTAASSLTPWALLAFVCGFERDKAFMLSFERHWKQRRDRSFLLI